MAVQHRYRRFSFSELRPQALLFLIVLTLTASIIVPPMTGKADGLVFYPGGYIRVAQTLAYGNSFYLLWENHTDGQDLTADNGYGVLFRRTGDEGQTFGETITLDKDAGQQPLAKMVAVSRELPASGYALEIDGRLKAEFATRDGAKTGAEELKKRFPMLQIRIYDAQTNAREEI